MSDERAIPAGMVAWHGGDAAPADWDGGPVLFRNGTVQSGFRSSWLHPWDAGVDGMPVVAGSTNPFDIIAYTPSAPSIVTGSDERTSIYGECPQHGRFARCAPCCAAAALAASMPTDAGVGEPVDPTNEMLEASAIEWTGLCHGYPPEEGHYKFMRALWASMLAAAPPTSEAATADVLKEAAFGRLMFQRLWDSFTDDGWDIEINDLVTVEAVKAGLVSVEPFDPDVHSNGSGAAEPGDDFYQVTPAGRAALKDTSHG